MLDSKNSSHILSITTFLSKYLHRLCKYYWVKLAGKLKSSMHLAFHEIKSWKKKYRKGHALKWLVEWIRNPF